MRWLAAFIGGLLAKIIEVTQQCLSLILCDVEYERLLTFTYRLLGLVICLLVFSNHLTLVVVGAERVYQI